MVKKRSFMWANVDMREFYRKLLSTHTECPEVIVFQDLENEKSIRCKEMGNGEFIYYLKQADDMYDILIDELENGGADIEKAQPYEDHGLYDEEVWIWIAVVLHITDILNIRCPQIIFGNTVEAKIDLKRGVLFLPSFKPNRKSENIPMFALIARELRHGWQYKYHSDWFKGGYKRIRFEDNRRDYLNQKTELDAETYSWKLAGQVFGDDQVFYETRMIKWAYKINLNWSQDDISYFRALFN